MPDSGWTIRYTWEARPSTGHTIHTFDRRPETREQALKLARDEMARRHHGVVIIAVHIQPTPEWEQVQPEVTYAAA